MTPDQRKRRRPTRGRRKAPPRARPAPGRAAGNPPIGKMWSGRFREETHPLVERFTASVQVDRRLAEHDLKGSLAHCQALGRAGILSDREVAIIRRGLNRVRTELVSGKFAVRPGDEDIHMAIERRLTELIGPLGGKLHTGRSRNDQVALDVRLYLREALCELGQDARRFQSVLVETAAANLDVAMPGYTHLQRAQPVLFAHHLLAYVEMLERDRGRLRDAAGRLDLLPLGSGALAGTNFPVDRQYLAEQLGFAGVSENSLDAVSDRDFVLEVLAGLAILMMHLSRLSEELVLWTSQEFQFVELPDAFCTGSSMMPQKKNPDVPELVRARTGRVYGALVTLLTVMKGLPLSYNRDLQEDKPPLFDALDTVQTSLRVLTELMRGLTVRREVVARVVESGSMLATELADYLVTRGVPFREAHAVVGRLVRACLEDGRELGALTLDELRAVSPRFEKDVLDVLTVEGALERKAQIGGTARTQVERRLKVWRKHLA